MEQFRWINFLCPRIHSFGVHFAVQNKIPDNLTKKFGFINFFINNDSNILKIY